MIPLWTLLPTLLVGLAIGALAGWFAPRPRPPAKEEAASPSPAPAPEEPAPPPEQPVKIGMEDVVSELERRYQGRQVRSETGSASSGSRRRHRSRRPPEATGSRDSRAD